jgi:CheY-like chemotaxis protein
VVTRAIEIASPLLEKRQQELSIDVPSDLTVHADATRLGQVVSNLLSNAAKCTGIRGHIAIVARREGEQVSLAVRDNGIGIAPDMLRTIFAPFVQAPQPSARTAGGLGLGLAIVKSLVELHCGHVTAHSEGAGRGSEFRVMLPLATFPVGASSMPLARTAFVATGRRVLIVDDNDDAAMLIGEALDAQGYDTRTASDGPSALQIAVDFRPEIAVLDIGLPVMDGYELAQRLLKNPHFSAPRLIAVSGYGQETDRQRSREAGFEEHLAKPVSLETLIHLLEEPRAFPTVSA